MLLLGPVVHLPEMIVLEMLGPLQELARWPERRTTPLGLCDSYTPLFLSDLNNRNRPCKAPWSLAHSMEGPCVHCRKAL
jgi:hypothetical protein